MAANVADRIPDLDLRLGAAVASYFRAHAIEQAGREVPPGPPGWRRRRKRTPHGCYEAAGRWSGDDGATYTEGFAFSAGVPVWIPHAWLTDAAGGVIDLAWDEPGLAYIGVKLQPVAVARAIRANDLFGPLLPTIAAGQASDDEEA